MSNQLARVEPHAQRLEDAADQMDAAGIGGHATRGHAAVLRDMAACMRADAATGKLPDTYVPSGGRMWAGAEVTRLGGAGPEVHARHDTSVLPGWRECLSPIQAINANADNAIRVRRCMAEAKRLGFEIKPNEKIDLFKLDEALKGKDVERRISLKRNLHAMGMLA
jgi:hypothetical protein